MASDVSCSMDPTTNLCSISTDIPGAVNITSAATVATTTTMIVGNSSLTMDLLDLMTTSSFAFSSNVTDGDYDQTTNNGSGMRRARGGGGSPPLGMQVQIPIYVIIFLLSVLGNVLVMVTLIQNKKMRTVTNVFLLNLAVSDLLLAVFCMPFTIIPLILKNFVFGAAMCVMIRYLQGVSVSVSCFTLVAISLERYFAICRPLQSRSWQTLSHAYRCIAVCWLLAAVFMIPLAVYHQLRQVGPTQFRCVEIWENADWEKAYTMLINFMLLVLPIILMSAAYGCVCYTLWIGIKLEAQSERERQQKNGGAAASYSSQNGVLLTMEGRRMNPGTANTTANVISGSAPNAGNTTPSSPSQPPPLQLLLPSSSAAVQAPADGSHHNSTNNNSGSSSVSRPFRRFEAHRAMRQSNSEKSRAAKKRVIKMLFMIVIEFFVFWTPSYVIVTWLIFHPESARRNISPMVKSLFHLLSYVSACCNPITYCFMNKNFRQGFLAAFRCLRRRHVYASRRSEFSFSGHTASTRTGVSTGTTNYDKIRDSDEISEKSF